MIDPRGQLGLTLVEVLVSIVLGIVVLGGGVTALVSFLGQSASAERRIDAQDTARLAIDQLAIQLRSAMSEGGTGAQAVESVSDYSVTFLSPAASPSLVSNPRGLQHVRYCLGIGQRGRASIFRQTAPYDTGSKRGAPSASACPARAWETSVELAGYVVNSTRNIPLFTPTVDSTGNVTSLAVEAVVDMDPDTAPPATRLHTAIELRNVNRPPAAVLSCQPVSNGHALCDASASSDPDGQTLSYAWSMDGQRLAATGYRLDQPGLASRSTHQFEVTVTDSGGLSTSDSQGVTMP